MTKEWKDDQITELLGNFGRWQAILLILLGVFGFPFSWQVLVTSFLTVEPEFFCTPIISNNETEENEALPSDFDAWYKMGKQFLQSNESLSKCRSMTFDASSGFKATDEACQHWTYNRSFYTETLVTQFDLVCDNDFLLTVHQVVYMLGVLVGSFLSGIISDRFGRRMVMLWASLAATVFGSAASFSSSIIMFIILRFLTALTTMANFASTFVYCMELVGGDWRTVAGIGLEFPWAFAYSILPLLAYNLPNWSTLQLAISLPALLLFLVILIIPESPRWLLAEDRVDEAEDVLERALEVNGKQWPQHIQLRSTGHLNTEESSGRRESIIDLFRTPNLRRKTLLQYYLWFTASFVYYGLTLNSSKLIPGDIYINFTVSGLIEFPAYALTLVTLLYLGRRLPLASTYLLGGIFLLLTIVTPKGVAVLVVSSVGKFGVTSAFAIIYVYAAELYPTVLRNTGLGSSSMWARVGSILAPVAARELPKLLEKLGMLKEMAKWAPILLFAITSIVAAFLTLLLPETHRRPLPDAVEEAEEFGKHERFRLFDLRPSGVKQAKVATEGVVNTGFNSK